MPIKDLEQSSWLNGPNASYIESFYESWLKDPASVSEQWRNYFAQMLMEDAGDISREALHSEIVTSLANRPHAGVVCDVSRQDLEIAGKQVFVQQLIAAYRVLGTRRAQLDPLKRHEAPVIPELDPDFYGLTDADLDTEFHITNTYFGANKMPLRTLLTALRETYCSSIGAEFMYISDPVQKRWWQEKLERSRSRPMYTAERRRKILEGLTAAEGLERFLHTRYVGQKRFSLEWRIFHHGHANRGAAGCARRCRRVRDRYGPSRKAQRSRQHYRKESAGSLCRIRRCRCIQFTRRRCQVPQRLFFRHDGRRSPYSPGIGIQPVSP